MGHVSARSGSIRCGPTVKVGFMPYNMSDPQYWFDRAEDVRARANAMKDPVYKEKMLQIADDYEDLGLSARLVPKKLEDSPAKKNV